MRKTHILSQPVFLASTVVVGALLPRAAWAIPSFARREHLACTTCHTTYPELNAVGRSYKENGYNFLTPKNDEQAQKLRDHLGQGFVIDKIPGFTMRVESVPFEFDGEAVSTTPLDAAEMIMGGNTGEHWSYWAEIESAAEDGYSPVGNGLIQYRWSQALQTYAGWSPIFSRDPYNSISESRRVDHADHAAQDFEGSIGVSIQEESGQIGAFGRVGPMFYNVGVSPGPGVVPGTDDPLDYFGRVEFDASDKVGIGGYVYSVNVPGGSTLRAAVDANALTSVGTFKFLGQYDTLDSAVAVEIGWDDAPAVGDYWLIPLARLDVVAQSGSTSVAPTAGLGVQSSSGRVSLEVSEPVESGSGVSAPTAALMLDGLF